MAGCMGSSLAQTPLPVQPETAPPAAQASQTGASDTSDTKSDDSSDDDASDGAPVSETRAPSAAPSTKSSSSPAAPRYACPQPAGVDRRACDAIVQGTSANRNGGNCNRSVPYCASDLQAAYGITAPARNAGKGMLVGIVDAYGYPSAASDLAVYRKAMGLPECVRSCLRIVNQRGRATPLPKAGDAGRDGWRAEEALDLDMVSAICPNCKLVLVQANSEKSSDLAAAVGSAAGLGAVAILNAYGGGEESALDGLYRRAGRAVIASAGSGAGGVRTPCAYAAVVCVGGTSLSVSSSPRGWSERPWSNAATGCSAVVGKPAWQRASRCKTRAIPDLGAVADPATGVAVYQSPAGWQQMGGTSVGAAVVAALFALGPATARANAPQWIWRHGASGTYHRLDGAKSGYGGAAGWGTPNGSGGF